MDDVEVKRSGSRTPLIVAACALIFGLFIGLGIGVAIGIGTCEAAAVSPPPPPPSATTTTAAPTTAAETTQTCMTTKKRTTSSAMLDVLTGEQEISLSSDGLEDIEDYCRALIEFAKMGESDRPSGPPPPSPPPSPNPPCGDPPCGGRRRLEKDEEKHRPQPRS